MQALALIAAVIAVSVAPLGAALVSEIPAHEKAALNDGRTVVKSTPVPGAPWPHLSLYRVVDAPPSVVEKLFTDYAAAPGYTPGLLAADVIARHPDGSMDVRYTVKMPVLQKISYTVRNSYERNGNAFTVNWKLLKSPLAKSSDGSLRIEPYAGGKTILCYSNLCVPVTNLVTGLKNQALEEAKGTVEALAAESERRAALQASRN